MPHGARRRSHAKRTRNHREHHAPGGELQPTHHPYQPTRRATCDHPPQSSHLAPILSCRPAAIIGTRHRKQYGVISKTPRPYRIVRSRNHPKPQAARERWFDRQTALPLDRSPSLKATAPRPGGVGDTSFPRTAQTLRGSAPRLAMRGQRGACSSGARRAAGAGRSGAESAPSGAQAVTPEMPVAASEQGSRPTQSAAPGALFGSRITPTRATAACWRFAGGPVMAGPVG